MSQQINTVSFEYCHICPGTDIESDIAEANRWAPYLVKMFEGKRVQKCIMLDDIHATTPISDDFVNSLIRELIVKPDCIYNESIFQELGQKIIQSINNEERDFIYTKDNSGSQIWLREKVKDYIKFTAEFLVASKDNEGKEIYSCPTLTASSYLARLGLIGDAVGLNTIYGEKILPADYVLNLLPSCYLETEDKVQSLIEATFKKALRKIGWHFY